MPTLTRRNVLRTGVVLAIPSGMVTLTGCIQSATGPTQQAKSDDKSINAREALNSPAAGELMKIQYLEIVTPEVDALCRQYSTIYGIAFNGPDANLGGARTAKLVGGGLIGIRGPLRETETPVVRPYVLVDDIKTAVASAAEAGAQIAMPPTEIPEHGSFAIVIHGGIECGFWQN